MKIKEKVLKATIKHHKKYSFMMPEPCDICIENAINQTLAEVEKVIDKTDFKLLIDGAFKQYEDAHGKIGSLKGQLTKRMDKNLREAIKQKLSEGKE